MNYLYEALDKPTRLYIKQCPHCGLKYFGKSVKQDVENYSGSGKRWIRHLKKHGVKPVHLWNSKWYYDTSIKRFALKFSRINKIVESDNWANLIEEAGVDGGALSKSMYEKIAQKTAGVPRNWSKVTMKKHHEKIKNGEIINPHTKRWKIKEPDGSIIITDNLGKYCKEKNISQGNLSGFGKTKGYTAECLGFVKDLEITNVRE